MVLSAIVSSSCSSCLCNIPYWPRCVAAFSFPPSFHNNSTISSKKHLEIRLQCAHFFVIFKHFFSQLHLFLNSWKIGIIRRCLFQKCTEAYFSSSFRLHFLNSEFLMKLCTTQSVQRRRKDFFSVGERFQSVFFMVLIRNGAILQD